MQIHYIEDNDLDARLLERAARQDSSFEISVSRTLEDLRHRVTSCPVDCILLDVLRPESVSIEDDVRKVREHTDAPIVFITSGETDELRVRAASVGADAVIDKGEISPAVLKQLFYNISARHTAGYAHAHDFGNKSKPSHAADDLQRLSLSLTMLTNGLQTLLEVMSDQGHLTTTDYIHNLLEATQAIKAYAEDSSSEQVRVALHEHLDCVRARLSAIAKHRRINLSMNYEHAWSHQSADRLIVRLGIQHLLEGFIHSCPVGSSALIYAVPDGGRAKLVMFFSIPVLTDTDLLFSPGKVSENTHIEAQSSLKLGTLLLGLCQTDIHSVSNTEGQLVTILI